jgi:GMP synthase-like glutamine amidotransferase
VRAVLIANKNDCDPGLLGIALRQRGYGFTEYLREDHESWNVARVDSLVGIDLVVSLGSGWSTYWDRVSEPVAAERALLRAAHDRHIPILGVCFGAQMLSTALGGTVDKTPVPEVGWHSIAFTPESNATIPPTLAGPWMQWHYDRFSVPDDCVLHAESPSGPQIIQCGRSLGVQFHPEATESIVARWSEGTGQSELDRLGIKGDDLITRTRGEMQTVMPRCEALVEWFLQVTA